MFGIINNLGYFCIIIFYFMFFFIFIYVWFKNNFMKSFKIVWNFYGVFFVIKLESNNNFYSY